ncbi:hypothetical protein LguiB_001549 [Lonicera macranthoides]
MAFDFSLHTARKSTRGTQSTSQAPSKPPAVGLLSRSQFPKDFTFGSASSAFQKGTWPEARINKELHFTTISSTRC